jgi:hypothetical protein
MSKKIFSVLIGIMMMLIILLLACTRKNLQTIIEESGTGQSSCDTANMSYTSDINPILENNCVSCHNNVQANDGVILTNYNDVVTEVNNGILLKVINHTPGYPEMPQGLPQLPSCTINKITAWVNEGAPNN